MEKMQIVGPTCMNVEAQYVELFVPLYSYGCEKKVKKTLSHLKGIYSVNVDYNEQKVTVWGICNKYDVLTTMRSKRKDSSFWNREDNNNNIMEFVEPSPRPPPPTPPSEQLRQRWRSKELKLHFALIRAKSFSWKSVKKAFNRSYSF